MKKILTILTAILSLTMVTSCSKNNDDSSKSKDESSIVESSIAESNSDSTADHKVNQTIYDKDDVTITLKTFNYDTYKMNFKVENKNKKSFVLNFTNITLNGKAYDFSIKDKTTVKSNKTSELVGYCQLDGKAPGKSDWNNPLDLNNELETVGVYFNTKLDSNGKTEENYKVLRTPKYIESSLEHSYGEFYSTFNIYDCPVNVYLNKQTDGSIKAVLQNVGEKSIDLHEEIGKDNKTSSYLFVNDNPYKSDKKQVFNGTLLAFGGIQIYDIDSVDDIRKNMNISKDDSLTALLQFRASTKNDFSDNNDYTIVQVPLNLK